jgi:anaerobic magnesium-protoporphyrin IX monomethyl ester cyclase
MKVTLIEPRTPFINIYSAFIKQLPLLGPIYLGTILKNAGHDVVICNENMKDIDWDRIKDSEVVGISIMTSTAPRGYEISQKVRELNPRARVLLGGSHATFLSEEAAEYADNVVTGEAESVIIDLVEHGSSEKIIAGKPVENLDELPFPDFSLIDGLEKQKVTPVSTSRGCPFDCTFCSVTAMFGRKYRYRSTDSVIKELSRMKHRKIFFYDDNFDANKSRTSELLHKMIRHKITPQWIAQTRSSVTKDEEFVKLMSKSNCWQLCIGFESLNPDSLKKYNKKQTPDDVKNCIRVLHKYKIRVHGMFISDGYTDIYNKIGVDSLQLCVLVPLIGSKLYTAIKDSGRLITDRFPNDWKLFDGGHVVHWPDSLSPAEMQRQTIKALGAYYSRANVTKLFLQGKFQSFAIRLMGHNVLKKWKAQNKDYDKQLSKVKYVNQTPGFLRGKL